MYIKLYVSMYFFVKTEHDKNSFSYRIAMILLKMKCGER